MRNFRITTAGKSGKEKVFLCLICCSNHLCYKWIQTEKSPLFTPQLLLMGNKCGAFLQSYPDAPVVHVEKLSVWTGSEVSGAQGILWDKRLAGRDEGGWRGEERGG